MVDLIIPLVVGALVAGAVLAVLPLTRSKFRGVNRQADSSKSNALRLRQYWKWFLAEGVILVLLGGLPLMGMLVALTIDWDRAGNMAGIVVSIAAFLVFLLQGFLFLLLGIVRLKRTDAMWPARGSWCSMISAVLAILILPTFLAETLYYAKFQSGLGPRSIENLSFILSILVFAAFVVVEGMATITYALDQRRERSQRWRWMLLRASGAGYLLFGIMLALGGIIFPLIGMLAFFLMPVALLIGGATMIAVARAARGGSEQVAGA